MTGESSPRGVTADYDTGGRARRAHALKANLAYSFIDSIIITAPGLETEPIPRAIRVMESTRARLNLIIITEHTVIMCNTYSAWY